MRRGHVYLAADPRGKGEERERERARHLFPPTDGKTLTRLRVATWGTGEEGRKIPGSTGDEDGDGGGRHWNLEAVRLAPQILIKSH